MWRDVTNSPSRPANGLVLTPNVIESVGSSPSRPANGLVLTPNVIESVGSSMRMAGSASGCSASATV